MENGVVFNNGLLDVEISFDPAGQSVWATERNIAQLFGREVQTISEHIHNIYNSGELEESSTCKNLQIVQREGSRDVSRVVRHYNFDVVLSVGYRVNSQVATRFRQWATQILKGYLEQGYVINEQALRDSPEKLNELAAKIRALRSEEKQVYAKVRECFKIGSSDYDPSSKQVRTFYALLQDKFHHAVTGMTSSKLVLDRAHHTYENMGLQGIGGSSPTWAEAQVGKNYLRQDELYRLHLLSEQFLLYAESTALAGRNMTMESLHAQLDRLLVLNEYPVFDGYTDYIKDQAIAHAKQEYELYQKRLLVEAHGVQFDEELYVLGEYDHIISRSH